MLRAVLYARYSTGNQSPLSVDAQLRLCREKAAAIGAHVVREFIDPEISGFVSGGGRPQYQALLALARAGGCDVVICEHSNRMARDGEAGWHVFNLFKRLGLRYVTVQESDMTVMSQAISTLMSEHKGEEVSQFTRRGLHQVVEDGRSAGGLSYGYRVKREYDARGEPIRGLLEIDPAQADVVRRIFRAYAAGASPLALAAQLNAEGVPGPRGGLWNHSTIAGSARRGNGILHNELYVGVRVWGRRRFVKDRATGTRTGRDAETPHVRDDVPGLRILDPDLWDRARARHAEAAYTMARDETGRRIGNGKRPKHFLSGLIRCGLCDGPMTKAGPKGALRCATRAYRKGCENTSAPGYAGIEARVVASVKANLLHPDVIEHAIRLVQEGLKADRRDAGRRQAKLSAELAETKRRADRFLELAADGAITAAELTEKLTPLRARRADLEAHIAEAARPDQDVIPLGPVVAGLYRRHVEQLSAALDHPEDADGADDRAAVRSLIERIVFTPTPGHGQYDLSIEGDLAPLLALADATKEKSPLAGALGTTEVVPEMGAGTRVSRRHRLPFVQAA